MSDRARVLRRLLVIALTWGSLWLVAWTCIGVTVGILDPDSIGKGEPEAMVLVLGPMGLLCGLAFGTLLSLRERGRMTADLPFLRTTLWGVAGTALVQVGYLGHGDAGLASNMGVAAAFTVVGGTVTAAWLAAARRWWRGLIDVEAAEARHG